MNTYVPGFKSFFRYFASFFLFPKLTTSSITVSVNTSPPKVEKIFDDRDPIALMHHTFCVDDNI